MKYAHVCYRVFDIDRSVEFYCGALGFKELKRYPIRDEAVESRLMRQIDSLMQKNDAPPEAFLRLGLAAPSR